MKALTDYIESKKQAMLALLEKLVNIDSGTYDKAGVDRVGNILADRLEALGFTVERSLQEKFGDHLIGCKPGGGKHRILFIGHTDTVFPAGSVQKRPFRVDGGRVYGLGVADMKGGIVCLLYALEALKVKNPAVFDEIAMDVVFNSDEEILSPTSRPIIEKLARQAQTVCVFEPARPGGEYVIQRKGVGKYSMKITGRAAHAGTQPEEGRSAIAELAHKIIALHGLSGNPAGATVNVGVVSGGERSNIIAESAYADIDLRVPDMKTAEEMERRIKKIAQTATVSDTICEVTGGIQFPPMPKTPESKRLFESVKKAGRTLGIELREIATGGGSDGNLAAQFAPTIDGMGPQGGGAHSDREYMVMATLTERSKVTALFLAEWPEVVRAL